MRDSQTGKLQTDFQTIFRKNREQYLPDWAERSRFDHYFRLAINTTLSKTEMTARYAGEIQVRDAVSIL